VPKSKASHFTQTSLGERVLKIYLEIYPKKVGKTKGLEKLKKDVISEQDVLNFEKAVMKYKSHCEEKRIEEKFIKQFDTFVTTWRDWLDPEVGSASISQAKSAGDLWLESRKRKQGVEHA
jgi:hypothetical protein